MVATKMESYDTLTSRGRRPEVKTLLPEDDEGAGDLEEARGMTPQTGRRILTGMKKGSSWCTTWATDPWSSGGEISDLGRRGTLQPTAQPCPS